MKFELQTLEEYSDDALLTELRRVAGAMDGQRLTLKRFNSLARVHSTTLRYRFGSWQAALEKAGISEEVAPRFRVLSREQIIQALRDFATEKPGDSVTINTIAEKLGVHTSSITRRFGRWDKLLSEVGIEPVPLGRRYTDEECYENLLSVWMAIGRQPFYSEMKMPPSRIGPKAYVGRWSSWRGALAAFVKRANQDLSASEPKEQLPPQPTPPSTPTRRRTPRGVSLGLRYSVLSRDGAKCVRCHRTRAEDKVELHVDHIIPWSKGGETILENLRMLCSDCNLGKGATSEDA